ncbi:hypothetical protein RYX36_034510 [Vicia faba]
MSGSKHDEALKTKDTQIGNKILEIEVVAESLGAINISNVGKGKGVTPKASNVKRKKWTRRHEVRKANPSQDNKLEINIGKRHLVDVMIIEGTLEGCESGDKKRRGQD